MLKNDDEQRTLGRKTLGNDENGTITVQLRYDNGNGKKLKDHL